MGRIVTPTYRVETASNIHGLQLSGWDCKRNGRPSDTRAENYRTTMNQRFLPGGVNFGISEASGVIVHLSEVRIVRQSSGEVVARAKAPRFEVV